MEIISEIFIYAVVAIAAIIVGAWTVRRLDRILRKQVQEEVRYLTDPDTRAGLTAFLQARMICGDADIRQGRVYPPVHPDKLEPLANVLGQAVSIIDRLKNPNSCSLYIRDSERDRWQILGELDLLDIADAARVIQRVAEDRKKSRSLYKGLTAEETRSIVRIALQNFYKDREEYDQAELARTGKMDDSDEFYVAENALTLLYSVKGAASV